MLGKWKFTSLKRFVFIENCFNGSKTTGEVDNIQIYARANVYLRKSKRAAREETSREGQIKINRHRRKSPEWNMFSDERRCVCVRERETETTKKYWSERTRVL